ncbi:MAG TPA: ATP phosphoribosyltransferase regulatory subunit [Candidatus Baltobacteraceae bacterium]|jgi:ATP phosphoribosyltransferase regulatory subunit|nr:ATP phosphoribosyltransferase regulatory subunit [Candidatus Baltobacteraceae bacterium]
MRLPAGVRDWLPQEFAYKREIEETIRRVFRTWSYAEVLTPTFESYESLERGLGEKLMQQTFRFTDPLGSQLALRTEMTTPIARVVSARLRKATLPLRLSYVATGFRYEEPQLGRMREFTQAGAELIGGPGVDAEAEVLFMAIETLDAVGLSDARFDVNDAAIVDGILQSAGHSGEELQRLKRLIADRNVVAIEDETIRRLTMTRGRDDILAAMRPLCETPESIAALQRLERILERASALGYRDRINVDFALLRDLQYYTGFVFEGYIADLGFSLCGGGRYDSLLPRFGYDVPAVGWMVGVERILLALERRREDERPRNEVDVLVSGSDEIAARERRKGLRVRMNVRNLDRDALLAYAEHKRIPRVIIAGDDVVEEVTLADDNGN